jgi:hypothetical protein
MLPKSLAAINPFDKHQKAKKIKEESQVKYENILNDLKNHSLSLNNRIENYGNYKLTTLTTTVKSFLDFLKKIGHDNTGKEYEILSDIELEKHQINDLHDISYSATNILTDTTTVITIGMGLRSGAIALATKFATVSSGTAISSLSGAAGTNATLAFFGGGSIASGGFGMAGGALVLTGIGVIPAVLGAGWIIKKRGEISLTKATEFEAEIEKGIGKIEIAETTIKGIESRVYELHSLLFDINNRAKEEFKKLISINNVDFNNKKHVEQFQKTALLIKTVTEIINTPLINDNGDLTEDSRIIKMKTTKLLNSKNL